MSNKEVAKWLYDKIIIERTTYQETAVYEIAEKFGDKYTYMNPNDNLAIDKNVLKEFGKLKSDEIEWDSQEKCWHANDDR